MSTDGIIVKDEGGGLEFNLEKLQNYIDTVVRPEIQYYCYVLVQSTKLINRDDQVKEQSYCYLHALPTDKSKQYLGDVGMSTATLQLRNGGIEIEHLETVQNMAGNGLGKILMLVCCYLGSACKMNVRMIAASPITLGMGFDFGFKLAIAIDNQWETQYLGERKQDGEEPIASVYPNRAGYDIIAQRLKVEYPIYYPAEDGYPAYHQFGKGVHMVLCTKNDNQLSPELYKRLMKGALLALKVKAPAVKSSDATYAKYATEYSSTPGSSKHFGGGRGNTGRALTAACVVIATLALELFAA